MPKASEEHLWEEGLMTNSSTTSLMLLGLLKKFEIKAEETIDLEVCDYSYRVCLSAYLHCSPPDPYPMLRCWKVGPVLQKALARPQRPGICGGSRCLEGHPVVSIGRNAA